MESRDTTRLALPEGPLIPYMFNFESGHCVFRNLPLNFYKLPCVVMKSFKLESWETESYLNVIDCHYVLNLHDDLVKNVYLPKR